MNLRLPKNEKFMFVLVILLLIAAFTGVYFLYLYPKMEMVNQKETELETQERLLSTLQNKVNGTTSKSIGSTVELQKRVPVKPLAQQLLLEIEEAEVLSGSFVANIAFEDNKSEQEQAIQDTQSNTNQSTDQSNAQNSTPSTPANGEEKKLSLPAGVKKLTATLNVESPTYFEFEKFIKKIENGERIIVVESIDFNAGEEIISTGQKDKPLTYQVKLSAFYMPNLTDLIDQLPKIESPEPGNKKNPLNNFGDFSKDKIETLLIEPPAESDEDTILPDTDVNPDLPETDENEVPDNNNTDTPDTNIKMVKYIVQPGDTLEKIALEFYNSTNAVKLIKEVNNLTSNSLKVGQTLKIPLEL